VTFGKSTTRLTTPKQMSNGSVLTVRPKRLSDSSLTLTFSRPSSETQPIENSPAVQPAKRLCVNPLEYRDNYSATSNDIKLVDWPLMGGLLHLVERGGHWTGPQPA